MDPQRLLRLHGILTSGDYLPDIRLLSEDPTAYLKEDIAQTNAVTKQWLSAAKGLSIDAREPWALLPRLYVLAVACVLLKSQDGQSAFHEVGEIHSLQVGESAAQALASYASLQSRLLAIIRAEPSLPVQLEERILRLNLRSAAALVLVQLEQDDTRDSFLRKVSTTQDQGLMDLLQLLLDEPDLCVVHEKLLRAQLKLAKHTGVYPSSLRHPVIEDCTPSPVAIGGFGDIYRACLGDQKIAVKVMRGAITGMSRHRLVKSFAQEVVLWSHVNHPNILPFYGVHASLESQNAMARIALLSPWMEHGNAIEYVKANPHVDREVLLLDIVHGLDYLHSFSPAIVHGDLKGDNILVSPSGRACIADFGLGRLVQDKVWLSSAASTLFGAHLYLAPELLDDSELGNVVKRSLSTDIYAFGCVCYELYSGRPRFSDIPSPMRRLNAILTNRPSPKPPLIGAALWQKVLQCWEIDAAKRPLVADFYFPLKGSALSSRIDSSPYRWDGSIMSRIFPQSVPDAQNSRSTPPNTRLVAAPYPTLSTISRMASPLPEVSRHRSRGIRLQGWKTAGLTSSDLILLILGAPLSGKTTFVKKYFEDPALPVGPIHHQLLPPSHELTAYLESGRELPDSKQGLVVMIDTPGLFSWKSDDLAIMKEITEIFDLNRSRQVRILYLHDISCPRMTIDISMSISVLKAICGKQGYPNVWLATTHWGRDVNVLPRGYAEREAHLKSVYWAELLEGGVRYRRIHGASNERSLVNEIADCVSADNIVSPTFLIQQQLSQGKGDLRNTDVWANLKKCLGMLLEEEAKSGGDKERRTLLKRRYQEMKQK